MSALEGRRSVWRVLALCKPVLGLLVAASGLMALAVAVSAGSQTQLSRDTSARRSTETYRVDSFDDLLPQTPDERARAKFFNQGDPNVREMFRHATTRPGGGSSCPTMIPPDALPDLRSEDEIMRDWICEYSDVFIGTPRSKRVLMTQDEGSLFTDYTVQVDRWIRSSGESSPVVIASRIGAIVQIAGREFNVAEGNHPRLAVPSLFIARTIPGSSALNVLTFNPLESFGGGQLAKRSKDYVESVARGAALCSALKR